MDALARKFASFRDIQAKVLDVWMQIPRRGLKIVCGGNRTKNEVIARKASKGVRRLALLLGSIGSTVWLIFVAFASNLFTEIKTPRGWVNLVLSFLIPFLIVHGNGWVIRGFQKDNKKGN
jgi:hypothetical protein